MGSFYTTAGALRAILCFIDPENTPKIAYDKDEYAEPLIEKLKNKIGDKDGSQTVVISFGYHEKELERQFNGICGNIKNIFNILEMYSCQDI